MRNQAFTKLRKAWLPTSLLFFFSFSIAQADNQLSESQKEVLSHILQLAHEAATQAYTDMVKSKTAPPQQTNLIQWDKPEEEREFHSYETPFAACLPMAKTRVFHRERPDTGFFRTLMTAEDGKAARGSFTIYTSSEDKQIYKEIIQGVSTKALQAAQQSLAEVTGFGDSLFKRMKKQSFNDSEKELLEELDVIAALATNARFHLAMAGSAGITLPIDHSLNWKLSVPSEARKPIDWKPIDPSSAEGKIIQAQWDKELVEPMAAYKSMSNWDRASLGTQRVNARIKQLRLWHMINYQILTQLIPMLQFFKTKDPDDLEKMAALRAHYEYAEEIRSRELQRLDRLKTQDGFDYADIDVLQYLPQTNDLLATLPGLCPHAMSLYYHRVNDQFRKALPLYIGGAVVPLMPFGMVLALTASTAATAHGLITTYSAQQDVIHGTLMSIYSSNLVHSPAQIQGYDQSMKEQIGLFFVPLAIAKTKSLLVGHH